MSEEVKQPEAAPVAKAKQYLLMADEVSMMIIAKLMPGMLFVQVEGMAMQGNSEHMLLVNPIAKPPAPETVPVPGVNPVEAV